MAKLSILIVLSIIAIAIKAAENKNKEEMMKMIRPLSEACVDEYNDGKPYTDEEMELALSPNPKDDKPRNVICLNACLYGHFGLLTDDDKLDAEKLAELTEIKFEGKGPMASEIAKTCNTKYDGDDLCDAVQVYNICIMEELQKKGIDMTALTP